LRGFTEFERKEDFDFINEFMLGVTDKCIEELAKAIKLSINALINDIRTKKIIEKGKNYDFSIYDIIELIEKNPSLMDINKHVQHKKV